MERKSSMKIGIVAPSSQVPQVELTLGIQKLREVGFEVVVHPQCKKSHLFFAGQDELRAQAFFEFAQDPQIEVLWCARGGYGAIRLLALLEKLTSEKGAPPPKLLVGYSDITALMDFVQKRWGWQVLHAPLPSLRKFSLLPQKDWRSIQDWVRKKPAHAPWEEKKLKFWSTPPTRTLQGVLEGGNLTVWTSLIGTPYQPDMRGKFVFFEDVDEALYRMDRMLQQIHLSGALTGVRAIVLGNFLNCKDASASVLSHLPAPRNRTRVLEAPKAQSLRPLRKVFSAEAGLKKIWGEFGERLGVPVVFGLPVGHGPQVSPLPLGARYELTPQGKLKLLQWEWLEEKTPRQVRVK